MKYMKYQKFIETVKEHIKQELQKTVHVHPLPARKRALHASEIHRRANRSGSMATTLPYPCHANQMTISPMQKKAGQPDVSPRLLGNSIQKTVPIGSGILPEHPEPPMQPIPKCRQSAMQDKCETKISSFNSIQTGATFCNGFCAYTPSRKIKLNAIIAIPATSPTSESCPRP